MSNDVTLFSMETVVSKEIDWMWYPYIPYGKVTIVQGDPGEGKTTFVLQLAARLSRGKGFEQGATLPLNIIYQTAEDGLADTIKPRLEGAQADCSRILVIDDTEKSLTMQDERLELAIHQTGAKLLVLDPIQAYIGERVDMNRANEAREATRRLAAVAERTGCAVVLIGHMNKGSGAKAAYRGIGSIDFYAIARSVLLVARVPDQPNIRAVAQIKNNLAPEGDTVAFKLGENSFEWIGKYSIGVDELLSGFTMENKHQQAVEFLQKCLMEQQSVAANDIFVQAKALGVSKRTMENVKQELNVKSKRVGATWHWYFEKDANSRT